jgi:hypothetical protein
MIFWKGKGKGHRHLYKINQALREALAENTRRFVEPGSGEHCYNH